MKQLSNSDYALALRLLHALSQTRGETRRERENARKAYVLLRKMKRKEERENGNQCNTRQL